MEPVSTGIKDNAWDRHAKSRCIENLDAMTLAREFIAFIIASGRTIQSRP